MEETETPPVEQTFEQVSEETPVQIKEGFDSFDMFKQARTETKDKSAPKLTEEKVEEKTEVHEEPKEEVQVDKSAAPLEPTDTKPKPRDYSIFKDEPPEFQAAVKKTGGPAFDILKSMYAENKQLKEEAKKPKSDLPPAYYSNPNGYLLHPEYSKTVGFVNQAESIVRHWKEQQISIKKTGKFRDLDQDPKTGKFIMSDLKDATDEDEINIDAYLDHAKDQASNMRGKLNGIVSSFKQTYEGSVAKLREDEKQFFPDYDKPDHPTQKMQKAILESLPEIARGEILAPLVQKMGAMIALFRAENATLKKDLATAKNLKTDVQAAPPAKSNFQGSNGKQEMSWDFFKNVRHEGK